MTNESSSPSDQALDDASDLSAEVVLPLIFALDDRTEGCTGFSVFIDLIHVLVEQGFTKEELLKEVETHYALHTEGDSEPS